MALQAGQLLTFYEILGPLGAGGMGEVYRARDTRLEREVAIKVLPDELADDLDRMKRFEREAKTLAVLNHTNVAGIHGIDQDGDTCFLAMELVRGEDLADRLRRGALPLDEAIDTCRQIAEGLEAAHEAGIVHRDLKPANVRVTSAGVVKLLDFGLAKPTGGPLPSGASESTGSARPDSFLVTSEGVILGTPTYMSPEQARGRHVDKRTDIWAFGCVLYECLTGRRAFAGDAFGELVAAILEHDVDLDALPPSTPRALRELIERCLVKDPRRRLRDIGEARLLLEVLDGRGAESMAAADEASAAGKARRRPALAVRAGALVVIGALAAACGWWLRGGSAAARESWSKFTQLTDLVGAETGPSLSPDGGSVAYASRVAGSWDIYVQRVGGRNRTPIAADPERDETCPAFSPDGRLVAYDESDDEGGIWVVGATGESHRRLTDFGYEPTWSPDGEHIAFATQEVVSPYDARRSRLWRVASTGGEPVMLDEGTAFQPAWSPSGERIAFWFQEGGQRDLATVSAKGGDRRVLLDDAPLDWSPAWSPDGRYLYFSSDRGGSLGLWRLPIDEASGSATGDPELVVGGLEASVALPSFSADGRLLAFRSETISVNPGVIPFDPDTEVAGTPRALLQRTGILRPTSVSPDGKSLALSNRGERQEDVFLMETDGTGLRRITDDLARDRCPWFSPDGTQVLFNSNREGWYAGNAMRLDGSGRTQLTDASIGNIAYPSLEPGGTRLACYVEFVGYVLAEPPWPVTESSYTVVPPIALPSGELAPSYSSWTWSPDGRSLAGQLQHPSGASEGIGVHDVTTGEGRLVATDEALSMARWLPDSRRLVYFRSDTELAVLDVATSEVRRIPVELPSALAEQSFAVAPDGRALYFGAERVESSVWVVERE